MTTTTVKDFYMEVFGTLNAEINDFLDNQNTREIGHFNVFDRAKMYRNGKKRNEMSYNRRLYYKISLIKGKNRVEYADRVVNIEDYAILFATPRVPYRYVPLDNTEEGHFCVFTSEFMPKSKTAFELENLPIFAPQSDFVFQLSLEQYCEVELIFNKMHSEIDSDYAFKYDLLRTYVLELIHYGQKLKPVKAGNGGANASTRILSLFIELLERQFPIESEAQVLQLRTARDYAENLKIHVNYLNKVLKETTGKTTTEIIASRIAQEAKILLKQTTWNISEIAYCLGFEEVAHFSNFFKKHTKVSPATFREII